MSSKKVGQIIIQKSQILSISLTKKFEILLLKSAIDNQPLGTSHQWLTFCWDKHVNRQSVVVQNLCIF